MTDTRLRPANLKDIYTFVRNANVHLNGARNYIADDRTIRPAAREGLAATARLLDGLLTHERNSPSAAFFVNGDEPTPSARLSTNSYDFTEVRFREVPAEHREEIRFQTAIDRIPYFGFTDYISVRAMALATKSGAKIEVNEDGVEDWLDTYAQTADYTTRFGHREPKVIT